MNAMTLQRDPAAVGRGGAMEAAVQRASRMDEKLTKNIAMLDKPSALDGWIRSAQLNTTASGG